MKKKEVIVEKTIEVTEDSVMMATPKVFNPPRQLKIKKPLNKIK